MRDYARNDMKQTAQMERDHYGLGLDQVNEDST